MKKKKEARIGFRQPMGSTAWIRLDGGFSVRACVLADMSRSGVRIVTNAPNTISDHFNLLLTRDAGQGQRCRVKWRRGDEIGAEFMSQDALRPLDGA